MDDYDFDQDELLFPVANLSKEEEKELNEHTLELLFGGKKKLAEYRRTYGSQANSGRCD